MEGDARDRVGVHGHLRQCGEDRGSNSEERASGEAVPSVGGHAANGNTFNGHPAEFVPSGSRRGRHHNHETHPSRKFLLSYFISLIINPPLLPNFFPFEFLCFASDIDPGRLQIPGRTMALRTKGKRGRSDGTAIRYS